MKHRPLNATTRFSPLEGSRWAGTMLIDAITAFFIMMFAFVLLLSSLRTMGSLNSRLEGYNQSRLESLRSGILLPDGSLLYRMEQGEDHE